MNIHTTNTRSETLWVLDSKLTTKIILYKRKREREREERTRSKAKKQNLQQNLWADDNTETEPQKHAALFLLLILRPSAQASSVAYGPVYVQHQVVRTFVNQYHTTYLYCTYFVKYRVSVLLFLGTFCYTDFCDGSSSPEIFGSPTVTLAQPPSSPYRPPRVLIGRSLALVTSLP